MARFFFSLYLYTVPTELNLHCTLYFDEVINSLNNKSYQKNVLTSTWVRRGRGPSLFCLSFFFFFLNSHFKNDGNSYNKIYLYNVKIQVKSYGYEIHIFQNFNS